MKMEIGEKFNRKPTEKIEIRRKSNGHVSKVGRESIGLQSKFSGKHRIVTACQKFEKFKFAGTSSRRPSKISQSQTTVFVGQWME